MGCSFFFAQEIDLSLSAKVIHYQCIWTLMMKGWGLRHRFKQAPDFKKKEKVPPSSEVWWSCFWQKLKVLIWS